MAAPRQQHVVVIGAGAAGHSAASTLRQEGYAGRLTVLHGEAHRPYNRTLVNKGVLPGLLTAEQISLPTLELLDVDVVTARVTALEADASELLLAGGDRVDYTALVVATGSIPRPLPPGWDESERLLGLHTVEDAKRIRELLGSNPTAASVTLLGAGFIGAETASHLADLGATVHLVSRPMLPLATAVGDAIARRVVEMHQDHVKTHLGREVAAIRAGSDSISVTLDDDTRIESDLVVVAHGTAPASIWSSGQDDVGVAVDDQLRAQRMRRVFAVGSVALHATTSGGGRYRVDHWDAAAAQGAHAARTLLHGIATAPDPGPYAPTTGFTMSLYRQPIAAYGVALPDSEQREHIVDSGDGLLTTFHDPHSGELTAAAGLHAGRELLSLRGQLRRP